MNRAIKSSCVACVATLLLAPLATLHADTPKPLITKLDLFKAGQGGYKLYRIPGIVVTAKGLVLAYCEARNSGSDYGEIEVCLRRSTDGGKTWGPIRKVAHLGQRIEAKDLSRNKCYNFEVNLVSRFSCATTAWKWRCGNGLPMWSTP